MTRTAPFGESAVEHREECAAGAGLDGVGRLRVLDGHAASRLAGPGRRRACAAAGRPRGRRRRRAVRGPAGRRRPGGRRHRDGTCRRSARPACPPAPGRAARSRGRRALCRSRRPTGACVTGSLAVTAIVRAAEFGLSFAGRSRWSSAGLPTEMRPAAVAPPTPSTTSAAASASPRRGTRRHEAACGPYSRWAATRRCSPSSRIAAGSSSSWRVWSLIPRPAVRQASGRLRACAGPATPARARRPR